ncbi:MAG: hypothetical protein ACRDJC_14105 [Thermomicrobiales bacterium]
MNATQILGPAAMSKPEMLATSSLVTPSPDDVAAPRAAWGACEIRLVADRVASLHTGSTHKVYRAWRFAVVMQHGHPRLGTTLFTIPVDPVHLAASRSRYALVQLATPGATAAGGPVAFSWSASSIGTADPFAAALAQVRRRLAAAGWTPDAVVPTHYAKTEPTMPVGEAATMSSPATAAHDAVSGGASEPGTSRPVHLRMAKPPSTEVTGLDGWETDGGAFSPRIDRVPAPGPGANRGS